MDFRLPELGKGVYEAELVSWLVKPGAVVKRGQSLMELLAAKATLEVPSPFAGTIAELKAEPGQRIKVGQVVLIYTPEDWDPVTVPLAILAVLATFSAARAVLGKGRPRRARTRYPISSLCPSCGASEHEAVEPETKFAFTNDRICKACGSRYAPPTPSWAASLFVAFGLLLLGLTIYSVFTNFTSGFLPRITARLFELTVGFTSIVIAEFGIKAFRERKSLPHGESEKPT